MIERVDSESRASESDHLSIRVWLRILACANLIEGRVRSGLREEFETTLPRFDLMAQLERVPGGLKMNEISRRMMVTDGNITRITEQLVQERLVSRTVAPDDQRAAIVRLTAAGRRVFADMARAHESWIVSMFGGLSETQLTELHGLLARLKNHLTSGGE